MDFKKNMKQGKAISISKKHFMIKKKGRLTLFWIVIGLFLATTVFLTIDNTTKGARLAELGKEEIKLLEQNRKLSNDLVKASSLISLEEKAESLGFKKPEKIIYVLGSSQVAKIPEP